MAEKGGLIKIRGVVIGPKYRVDNPNHIEINEVLDSLALRQYLLYWDKIDYPANNLISYGEDVPEVKFLEQSNILKRSFINVDEIQGNIGEVFVNIQQEAFSINNRREPGVWSLAQPNEALVLNKIKSEQVRSLEVKLYDSLPVPSTEVSLSDILEFKNKRNDELLSFRVAMDEMYQTILSAPDSERQRISVIESVQRRLLDIHKLMDESKIQRLKGSLKVNFNLSDAIVKAVGAAIGGSIYNFPVEYGAMLGLASSFIKVDMELGRKPKNLPGDIKDFAYLYYAQKEL